MNHPQMHISLRGKVSPAPSASVLTGAHYRSGARFATQHLRRCCALRDDPPADASVIRLHPRKRPEEPVTLRKPLWALLLLRQVWLQEHSSPV